jgi:amidophosphoribosyltransferase
MSDQVKHECGIALVRLLKPLSYYKEKYGTPFYGVNKLYLLMEKQHNRGQDGAGVASIKLDQEPGTAYINRQRSNAAQPIADIFGVINNRFADAMAQHPEKFSDTDWLKRELPFTGELLLGHLRYGTYGKNNIESCHPFLRQNNWMTRNLVLAGNFNLTNVDELLQQLLDLGQHPKEKSDTVTVLEKVGHFLDEENELLFERFKAEGHSNREISSLIANNLDIQRILTRAAKGWDGGYAIAGMFGHGDAFVMRDPCGIRPAWYFQNEEVVVVASERPAMQTAFNIPVDQMREVPPGSALIIRRNGEVKEAQFREPMTRRSCSFERIYFSRGSDVDIYKERKALGRNVCSSILECVDYDLRNTVFSYVPNTAETAFYGMVQGMEDYLREVKKRKILQAGPQMSEAELDHILSIKPRIEKIAIKDAKLRTFITDDAQRDDLVAHVYDITYGTVNKGIDNLVVIDDSIVRGTTLKKSILRMLDRLGPRQIVIVSSAPQIRYPDCYGIDMARLGDFVAFQAAISLLKKNGKQSVIDDVYERCKVQLTMPTAEMINPVKDVYRTFTANEISEEIANLIRPDDLKADLKIVYQKIEDLHAACPEHTGDWYFSGDYPTPGGNKVACRSFVNYIEGKGGRAY